MLTMWLLLPTVFEPYGRAYFIVAFSCFTGAFTLALFNLNQWLRGPPQGSAGGPLLERQPAGQSGGGVSRHQRRTLRLEVVFKPNSGAGNTANTGNS